jgi:TonB-dependent receptor
VAGSLLAAGAASAQAAGDVAVAGEPLVVEAGAAGGDAAAGDPGAPGTAGAVEDTVADDVADTGADAGTEAVADSDADAEADAGADGGDASVDAGEADDALPVAAEGSDGINEIVVTGRSRRAATSLLDERIEKPVVVDLLGADQISRVGDSTVATALRRVPGISLVGDFIYIRGLGERYSSTTLNGAYVPSPDLSRNVIPLDIFPAEIIESISIQKGYTVDRPAAFGGGNIDIRTRRAPEEFVLSLQAGSGWNSESSGDTLTYAGGGRDWLGRDDGTRALPGEIQTAFRDYRGSVNASAIAASLVGQGVSLADAEVQATAINRDLATSLNRALDIETESANPDITLEGAIGNSWSFGASEEWRFGVLGLANYQNQWRNRERINRSSLLPELDRGVTDRTTNQVALTGSVTAQLDYTSDHSIDATVLYLRNTEDDASITRRNNFNFRREDGAQLRDYYLRYEERELDLLQFSGRHTLGEETRAKFGWIPSSPLLDDLTVGWYYSEATANTDIPNEVLVSAVDAIDPATGEVLRTAVRPTASAADFRFTELVDEVNSYGFDVRRPFTLGGGDWSGTLSGGWDYYEKGRRSLLTRLQLGTTAQAAEDVLVGTPGQVFSDGNILNPVNQFRLTRGGIGTESYLAAEVIDAGFGNVDVTWRDTWRVSLGARYEDWSQLSVPVDQLDYTAAKVPLTNEELVQAAKVRDDWYPSAAITWIRPDFLAEQFQLRLGYSQTTARPDLREVAQATYIDPLTEARVVGNPLLVPSDITNYDLRAEWFFDSGDNLTISPFYKVIDRPIETVEGAGTDNNLSFTFINAGAADLYGVEVEWLKQLDVLGRAVGEWAQGFFVSGNVTWSESDLTIGNSAFGLTNLERPLAQQSDWIVNLQLGWDSPAAVHSATLAYNAFSERLFFAGRNGADDAYEQPFESLDLIYSWTPTPNWSVRLRLQNLLNDTIEIQQGGTVILEQKVGVNVKLNAAWQF